jgi:hypothetical protein
MENDTPLCEDLMLYDLFMGYDNPEEPNINLLY